VPRPAPKRKRPDRRRAEAAVRELLDALGIDPADPNLRETPERTVKAWIDVLLEGYWRDPVRALGKRYPSVSNGAVVATHIPFLSMCPHHLLPVTGEAHVAFHPSGGVPGFGSIARLVDALAHRLVLQEDLTASIADVLSRATEAEAAVCVLEARHACVAVTDPARAATLFRTSASRGDPEKASSLLQAIDVSLRAPWRAEGD
jgi:GTP cyclohydrolase I